MVVDHIAFFFDKSVVVWNEHGKGETLACFDVEKAGKRFAAHNPLCQVVNGKKGQMLAGLRNDRGS